MRIAYSSDLHGHAALYDQLEALLAHERPDLLILGGDLFIDGPSDDPRGVQTAYVQRVVLPRLRSWRERQPGLHIACVNGNHDWLPTRAALTEAAAASIVHVLDHHQATNIDGLKLLGYSATPPCPYVAKDFERRDLDDDPVPAHAGALWDAAAGRAQLLDAHAIYAARASIAAELRGAALLGGDWLLVSHAPPHDTGLDRMLDVPGSLGSRAVRRFIEERRPRVALHGHFHDAPQVSGRFACRIGPTLCINPGQTENTLHAVIFESESPETTLRHTALAGAAVGSS